MDETALKILVVTMVAVTVINVVATQLAILYLSDLFNRALAISLRIPKVLVEDDTERKSERKP